MSIISATQLKQLVHRAPVKRIKQKNNCPNELLAAEETLPLSRAKSANPPKEEKSLCNNRAPVSPSCCHWGNKSKSVEKFADSFNGLQIPAASSERERDRAWWKIWKIERDKKRWRLFLDRSFILCVTFATLKIWGCKYLTMGFLGLFSRIRKTHFSQRNDIHFSLNWGVLCGRNSCHQLE